MAKTDKPAQRAMLERARVGWDYLESERRANLVNLITKEALAAFESSFAYSQTLPARLDSGLVGFYQALGRKSGRCSI